MRIGGSRPEELSRGENTLGTANREHRSAPAAIPLFRYPPVGHSLNRQPRPAGRSRSIAARRPTPGFDMPNSADRPRRLDAPAPRAIFENPPARHSRQVFQRRRVQSSGRPLPNNEPNFAGRDQAACRRQKLRYASTTLRFTFFLPARQIPNLVEIGLCSRQSTLMPAPIAAPCPCPRFGQGARSPAPRPERQMRSPPTPRARGRSRRVRTSPRSSTPIFPTP
jgi:hypothetical protein